ncbi:hypothetical protein NMY22_g14230 [Coprinellus aureogranulatus]|nr:hypothetical protein NMY22_g14230 [Coprinellus aureogranulatus]
MFRLRPRPRTCFCQPRFESTFSREHFDPHLYTILEDDTASMGILPIACVGSDGTEGIWLHDVAHGVGAGWIQDGSPDSPSERLYSVKLFGRVRTDTASGTVLEGHTGANPPFSTRFSIGVEVMDVDARSPFPPESKDLCDEGISSLNNLVGELLERDAENVDLALFPTQAALASDRSLVFTTDYVYWSFEVPQSTPGVVRLPGSIQETACFRKKLQIYGAAGETISVEALSTTLTHGKWVQVQGIPLRYTEDGRQVVRMLLVELRVLR